MKGDFLHGMMANSGLFAKLMTVLFVILLGFLLALIPVGVASVFIGANSYAFLHISQLVMTLTMFVLPPFVCVYLFYPKSQEMYKSLAVSPSLLVALLAILLIFASIPFMNWLVIWNNNLSLPANMSGIEEWMRNTENAAQAMTDRFLDVNSVGGLLLALFTVALVPALCEELFFRGFLQNLFAGKFSKHIAIWVTAVIFSAIHFQFFGFFPRLLLGAILGYLYFSTGSLWVSIIAHFVNNTLAVFVTVLQNWGVFSFDFDSLGVDSVWMIAVSAIVLFCVPFFLWTKRIEAR